MVSVLHIGEKLFPKHIGDFFPNMFCTSHVSYGLLGRLPDRGFPSIFIWICRGLDTGLIGEFLDVLFVGWFGKGVHQSFCHGFWMGSIRVS